MVQWLEIHLVVALTNQPPSFQGFDIGTIPVWRKLSAICKIWRHVLLKIWECSNRAILVFLVNRLNQNFAVFMKTTSPLIGSSAYIYNWLSLWMTDARKCIGWKNCWDLHSMLHWVMKVLTLYCALLRSGDPEVVVAHICSKQRIFD